MKNITYKEVTQLKNEKIKEFLNKYNNDIIISDDKINEYEIASLIEVINTRLSEICITIRKGGRIV